MPGDEKSRVRQAAAEMLATEVQVQLREGGVDDFPSMVCVLLFAAAIVAKRAGMQSDAVEIANLAAYVADKAARGLN